MHTKRSHKLGEVARILVISLARCSAATVPPAKLETPGLSWRADHHMHLSSPDLCRRLGKCFDCGCLDSNHPPAVLAADAVSALDAAHVSKGVILSSAYLYGLHSLHLPPSEEAKDIRLENAFTAAEVSKYPKRLLGFLSVNPLQNSALDELRDWAAKSQFVGLKLHFRASAVNIRSAADRRRIRRVLAAAAKEHLAIVIHLGGGDFDAPDAELFITDVLPSAGDSWVQIAHAGGGLPRHDGNDLRVLRTFANHIVQNDPSTRRVFFDLSYVPGPKEPSADVTELAKEIRRIGISRFLFGSDFNVLTSTQEIANLPKLGLAPEEWQILSQNCAPWAC
jgi:predicted TIM-barrel fold metal-dependent hydrolase